MGKLIEQPHGGKVYQMEKGETLNPNGRPPKVLTKVLEELREAGYQNVKVANVVEAYELLFGLDQKKIEEVVSDVKQPMIMRIVGKAMLSKKGTEMLEKMLDRAFGKPKQVQEVDNKISYGRETLDELKLIALNLNGNSTTKEDSSPEDLQEAIQE